MTPEEAKDLIIGTRKDEIIGAAVGILSSNTPGVFYRSQKKLDSAHRMMPDASNEEKTNLSIGLSAFLKGRMSSLGDAPKSRTDVILNTVGKKEEPESEHEEMAVISQIMPYWVNLDAEQREAISILATLDAVELRLVLAEMIDAAEFVEVLRPDEDSQKNSASYIMWAVRDVIPKNASITLGGLTFMEDRPALAGLIRAKVYRQDAIPTLDYANLAEITSRYPEDQIREAIIAFKEQDEEERAFAQAEIVLMTRHDFDQIDTVIERILTAVDALDNKEQFSSGWLIDKVGEFDGVTDVERLITASLQVMIEGHLEKAIEILKGKEQETYFSV